MLTGEGPVEACAGGGRATCGVRLRGHPTDHRFRSLAPGVAPALPALARAASFGMLAGFVFSPATRIIGSGAWSDVLRAIHKLLGPTNARNPNRSSIEVHRTWHPWRGASRYDCQFAGSCGKRATNKATGRPAAGSRATGHRRGRDELGARQFAKPTIFQTKSQLRSHLYY